MYAFPLYILHFHHKFMTIWYIWDQNVIISKLDQPHFHHNFITLWWRPYYETTFLLNCDQNVMVLWPDSKKGKLTFPSHFCHSKLCRFHFKSPSHFYEKVIKIWSKCDELRLVPIFWLPTLENSRHAKNQGLMPDFSMSMPVYSPSLEAGARSGN